MADVLWIVATEVRRDDRAVVDAQFDGRAVGLQRDRADLADLRPAVGHERVGVQAGRVGEIRGHGVLAVAEQLRQVHVEQRT